MPTEAELLNQRIRTPAPELFALFSRRGESAYYPYLGVTAQNKEAQNCRINAVRGQAFDDQGKPLVLPGIVNYTASKDDLLYSPPHGNPQLRTLWRERILRENPDLTGKQVSLPVVTNGLTQGLSIAYQLFNGGEPNEPIITPDLYWENYDHTFREASFRTFPFYSRTEFNLEGLEKAIQHPKKQFLAFAFPSNPSGYMPTLPEVDDIAKVISNSANQGSSLIVTIDDAYIGLQHEKRSYPYSLFNRLANLHESVLAIKIDGASKELYAWGLRVGFITFGNPNMTAEVAASFEDKAASLVRGDTSAVSTPSQSSIRKALLNPETEIERKSNNQIITTRYNIVKKILSEHQEYEPFFTSKPFNAGYFISLDVLEVDANEVRRTLIKNYSTGVLYFPQNNLRISYPSVRTDDLPELFENIYHACQDVRRRS